MLDYRYQKICLSYSEKRTIYPQQNFWKKDNIRVIFTMKSCFFFKVANWQKLDPLYQQQLHQKW